MFLPCEEVNVAAWICWLVIFGLFSFATTIWFHINRHIEPIRSRQPHLVLLLSLVLIAWTLMLCLHRIVQCKYPCAMQLWQAYIGVIALANIFLIRSFLLYGHFNLTRELVNADEVRLAQQRKNRFELHDEVSLKGFVDRAEDINVPSWWIRHKSLLKNNTLLYASIFVTMLLLFPVLFETLFNESIQSWEGDGCMTQWNGSATALSCYAALYCIAFIIFGYKLRRQLDAFGIKKELAWSGIVGILTVIPWFVLNNCDLGAFCEDISRINDKYSVSTVIILIAITLIYCLSVVIPLRISIIDPPKLEIVDPQVIKEFDTLIRLPEGQDAFQTFLESEFSVENILFWKGVTDLEKKLIYFSSQQKLQSRAIKYAKTLYEMYVMEGADLWVNINAKQSKSLKKMYNRISEKDFRHCKSNIEVQEKLEYMLNPFKDAKESIYNLMKTNVFKRFRKSDLYKTLDKQLTRLHQEKTLFVTVYQDDYQHNVEDIDVELSELKCEGEAKTNNDVDGYICRASFSLEYDRFVANEDVNRNSLQEKMSSFLARNIRIVGPPQCGVFLYKDMVVLDFLLFNIDNLLKILEKMERFIDYVGMDLDSSRSIASPTILRSHRFTGPKIIMAEVSGTTMTISFDDDMKFCDEVTYLLDVVEESKEQKKNVHPVNCKGSPAIFRPYFEERSYKIRGRTHIKQYTSKPSEVFEFAALVAALPGNMAPVPQEDDKMGSYPQEVDDPEFDSVMTPKDRRLSKIADTPAEGSISSSKDMFATPGEYGTPSLTDIILIDQKSPDESDYVERRQ